MDNMKRILIVDDDDEIRELLEFDVSQSGFTGKFHKLYLLVFSGIFLLPFLSRKQLNFLYSMLHLGIQTVFNHVAE